MFPDEVDALPFEFVFGEVSAFAACQEAAEFFRFRNFGHGLEQFVEFVFPWYRCEFCRRGA